LLLSALSPPRVLSSSTFFLRCLLILPKAKVASSYLCAVRGVGQKKSVLNPCEVGRNFERKGKERLSR
jgi:hypothetical protein